MFNDLTTKLQYISDGYAKANAINRDDDRYLFKLQEELGELTQAYLTMTQRARLKGKTPDEIRARLTQERADVFAHTILFAKHFNINMIAAIQEKWLKREEVYKKVEGL